MTDLNQIETANKLLDEVSRKHTIIEQLNEQLGYVMARSTHLLGIMDRLNTENVETLDVIDVLLNGEGDSNDCSDQVDADIGVAGGSRKDTE